ncbi:hypothetical protein E3983_12330 [Legionella israelensis]|uniref:Uncharacterized protein n=1 Tax=Legionella israelensis TaxID=454 RepID=A0AAX1EIZ4_9GAMM|nr:hypothetical protein [Legionella israelensis]QBR85067.1 hypothetical protein E3983_12330 [Legionella israelensis]
MKNRLSHRLIIPALLFLLFTAPGLVAIFLYKNPKLIPIGTSNKGQLLQSSVKMVPLGDSAKWKLLYWGFDRCEKDCLQQLDKLARIRLSLGRHFYEVETWLLLDADATIPTEEGLNQIKKQNTGFYTLSSKNDALRKTLQLQPKILLVSPNLDLVLSYPVKGSPDDIYKDLKHLLALPGKGSGHSDVS